MKANNNSPAIRFAGFTAPWERRKLKDYLVRYDNLRIPVSSSKRVPGPTPYYGANGIQDYVKGYTHDGQFILVAEDGANDVKNYPVQYVFGKVWVNNHAHVLQAIESIADNLFFKYSISQTDIEPFLVGGGRAKLNAETMMNIETSAPTKAEQVSIGLMLRRLDNLITYHQRKYEKLANLKKAMLDKMFPKEGKLVPEVRFSGFSGNWERRKLGEVGKAYAGLTGKSKNDFGHGTGKYVTYMNVFTNPVTSNQELDSIEIDGKQNEVQYGDVFFTTSSETPEEVGMASVCLSSFSNTYLNSFCFGFRLMDIEIDLKYLAYFLRSGNFRSKMIRLAQGISRYNISKSKVLELQLLLPSLQEQQMIGKWFAQLDNLIQLQVKKNERLSNIKSAFLEKMFV